MLLRIEPEKSFQISQSQLPSLESSSLSTTTQFKPLHVNLTTASHHHSGILLLVGRKSSDLPYQNERSVSRSHCLVRLLSLDANKEEAKDNKDTEKNIPIYPRTDEEKKACENAVDNLAIVVEDLGSKFGTKVSYTISPDKKSTSTTIPSNNSLSDCETEEEETDNEEQNPTVMDSSIASFKTIVKKLETNGTIILPTLSLPSDDESATDESHLTAVIQCGSVYFRITRIPLNFCVSRLTQTDKNKVMKEASKIGARILSTFELSTTHLITPNRVFCAKLICAWARSIPILTLSYFLEMIGRNDGSSPLPTVDDHLAKGKPLDIDSLEYTPDQPKHIMSEFLVLSLIETEAEMLSKCAGAKIHKLYSEVGDKTFWQNNQFFEGLIEESKEKGLKIIWIETTSRAAKKGKEYLLKKTKDQDSDINISCVTQSGIIRAITTLGALVDIEGKVLNVVGQSTIEARKDGTKGKTYERVDSIDQHGQNVENKEDNIATNKEATPNGINREPEIMNKSSIVDDKEIAKHDGNLDVTLQTGISQAKDKQTLRQENKEEPRTRNSQKIALNSTKLKSKLEETSSKHSGGWISSSQKSKPSMLPSSQTQESQSSAWISSQRTSKSGDLSSRRKRSRQDGSHGWMSTNQKAREASDEIEPQLDSIKEGNDEESIEKQPQKSLPKTDDGWFVAPKGKTRLQYKRDVNEILEGNQIGVVESAGTETCKLIVSQMQLIQPIESEVPKTTQRQDFKRFRKNSIIAGARMHSINPVALVARLPKESERRKELEESQIQYYRDQQAAESLFEDDVHSTNPRGIRSFFKPTEKGRSSRRRG